MINKTQKNRVIYNKIAEKIALDSIVDRVLTRLIGITMKNYIYAEISSQMENQLCEYVSFGGVICINFYQLADFLPTCRAQAAEL